MVNIWGAFQAISAWGQRVVAWISERLRPGFDCSTSGVSCLLGLTGLNRVRVHCPSDFWTIKFPLSGTLHMLCQCLRKLLLEYTKICKLGYVQGLPSEVWRLMVAWGSISVRPASGPLCTRWDYVDLCNLQATRQPVKPPSLLHDQSSLILLSCCPPHARVDENDIYMPSLANACQANSWSGQTCNLLTPGMHRLHK